MVNMKGVGVLMRLKGVMDWEFWKAIQTWWLLVNNKLSFVVGNELMVKFWRNVWCGRHPFMVPTLPFLPWEVLRKL